MWMWLPWLEMKQLRTVGPFPFRVSASASLVGHVHQIWESKQLFAVAFPANFLHWKSYLAELPPFYGKRIGLMSLMEHVNRKRPNLMVKTMVSCRFSIHQKMRTSARRLAYAVAAGICAIGVYAVHGILDQQALFGVTLGRTCLGIFFLESGDFTIFHQARFWFQHKKGINLTKKWTHFMGWAAVRGIKPSENGKLPKMDWYIQSRLNG